VTHRQIVLGEREAVTLALAERPRLLSVRGSRHGGATFGTRLALALRIRNRAAYWYLPWPGLAGDTTGNSPGSKWTAVKAIAAHLDCGRRYIALSNPVQWAFEDTRSSSAFDLVLAA
jgi:hypothetical protein